ncbi:hypothetical protein N301_10736, partial [Charadrius vociferus]
ASQTELLCEHVATQASGCRVCPAFMPVSDGCSEHGCGRCAQVEELLRLVMELREEVSRLRVIRECEREIDAWSRTLSPMTETQQADKPPAAESSHSSPQSAEQGGLEDRGQWQHVPARRSRCRRHPCPTTLTPSQVPLHNRYTVLQEERNNSEDGNPPRLEDSLRPSQTTTQIKTSSVKKKRRVIVMGDSILRGTEGPICRPDPLYREVCCLPGARVRDVKRKLPSLVRQSDYYPLLVFQIGSDDVVRRTPRAMKKDFRALGRLVKGSGAQVLFSSVPPVAGNDEEVNWKSQQVNDWLRTWCHRQGFGFFDHGLIYRSPGLLAADGKSLSRRGKMVLGTELAGLIGRALN